MLKNFLFPGKYLKIERCPAVDPGKLTIYQAAGRVYDHWRTL
ncbi:hypothetical protein MWLf4_2058 [Limosilactobacillus fermentum]|nr:hypothetical protein MWLf4_2058 [Limosilactobacillus fermentum]